jgi:hypothetical protein
MQTSIMLRHVILASLLILGADVLLAEQSTAPAPDTIKLPAGSLPYDPAKVAASIRDSYYHPDQLTSLDCDLSIDWRALFDSLKQNVGSDRFKTIQALKINSKAARGKSPELTFDWAGGSLDTKEQLENGLKQMVGGFYQMYWPMMASALIQKASEIQKMEPQPDGGAKAYLTSQNITVIVTIDKDHVPTHYSVDGPVMKGTIDPHYIPSPAPVPGDLRRLSGMNVSEQIGTSTINVDIELDYQVANGFYIPKHVTFSLVDAYSIPMEFSSCSASKAP